MAMPVPAAAPIPAPVVPVAIHQPAVSTAPKAAPKPNELVARASALEGVAGAMILLSDGFLVASKLPSEADGGVLAAFVPQILNRVGQSAAELKMGPLNRLSFTVGTVSWEIYRSGSVLFAAYGQPDKVIPATELAVIAAELDWRKDS